MAGGPANAERVRSTGFELEAPESGWKRTPRRDAGLVTFEYVTLAGRLVLEIKAEMYRSHDLSAAAGLEAALRFSLYEDAARFRYGPLTLESFAWQGTDCLRYQSWREGPDRSPGRAERWDVEGYFCRHPSIAGAAVTGLLQEVRPLDGPALALPGRREEGRRTLDSVRFLPLLR